MMELFSLNLTEVYFTTAAEGETLTRYTHIREKDLILADRAYATRSGIFPCSGQSCGFLASYALYEFFPSILRQVRGMTLQRC